MAKIFIFALALSCFVVAVYSAAIPDELKEVTKNLRSECLAETGAEEALVEKTRGGEFADDGKFKCYFKCLFEKVDLITDAGELDFDGMVNFIPESFKVIGTKMVNDCRGTTGADLCDKAYNLSVCLYKSNPTEYFVI